MHIISGTNLAKTLRQDITKDVKALKHKNITPNLKVILVGNNPASKSYVTAKAKACDEIGMLSTTDMLPENISQKDLIQHIQNYNNDKNIHGILVQLPLPKHIGEDDIIESIHPSKDVDGFHPVSLGRMMQGKDTFLPCTPYGIIKMLESGGFETQGKHVVIIGRSNIVGKPLSNMLLGRGAFADATVTVCHSKTPDLKKYTLKADILIAAVGKPHLITKDMVSSDTVVIDVGVNRITDSNTAKGYRLVGDVDFDALKNYVTAISPVPGGVGPMTITMLMYNTVKAAQKLLF